MGEEEKESGQGRCPNVWGHRGTPVTTGTGWLGRRKTLSPRAEGPRAGVGAGSGSVSKRTPLLGASVSVLCPGSRRGLGDFDGGIGVQIPEERRIHV